jgi:hypothetical protein
MISAGINEPINSSSYPNQGGYGGGYAQPQGPQVGTYQPLGPAAQLPIAAPSISASVELDSETGKKMIESQQKMAVGSMVANSFTSTIHDMLNHSLAMKSLGVQETVALRYYDSQDKIAGDQRAVAFKQLDVQEAGIYAQQEMHRDQTLHEEKMARIEGSVQARLASITEDGKTQRAEIMTMNDAFSRNGWDMGTPVIAA